MKTIEKMSDDYSGRLSRTEIEQIRHLPSFRPLVESLEDPTDVIAMLEDDEYIMNALGPLVRNIYCYFMKFHCYMRVLIILVKDLPHAPLGKHLRDIYPYCIGNDRCIVDTEEFQKCWQYLALMSKQEVAHLLEKCCHMMHEYAEKFCSADDSQVDRYVAEDARACIAQTIQILRSFIENLSTAEKSESGLTSFANDLQQALSLQELKQKVTEKLHQSRTERSHELKKVLDYLRDSVFGHYVLPYSKGPPLIELFVFSNYRSVQSFLKGAPRGAIHNALTNPQLYLQVKISNSRTGFKLAHNFHPFILQCNCCIVNDANALRPTMPDISIAYKLLLECGQQVNIYDWLTAFKVIVDPDNADENEIPAVIQWVLHMPYWPIGFWTFLKKISSFNSLHFRARFTRARDELQFLGFIKSSKRKTDHVTRTTW